MIYIFIPDYISPESLMLNNICHEQFVKYIDKEFPELQKEHTKLILDNYRMKVINTNNIHNIHSSTHIVVKQYINIEDIVTSSDCLVSIILYDGYNSKIHIPQVNCKCILFKVSQTLPYMAIPSLLLYISSMGLNIPTSINFEKIDM